MDIAEFGIIMSVTAVVAVTARRTAIAAR